MNRTILAFLCLGLLGSCAQIREPQGGPKDTTPPLLVDAEPPNGSIHFAGDRIILRFDERVKLDRVRERLLVSPPLDKAPDVSVVRGKEVQILLNAPLRPNATYTFNIGEAVVDLGEGNPAAGLTYVVSTGGHVDSLLVEGRVWDAASARPASEVLVLLHSAKDTGDVRTVPPAYFTRSDKEGHFRIAHLPDEPMRLYALQDRNGNYRYDLPTEEVAFLDGSISPGAAIQHELFLFRAASRTQFVASAKVLADRGWQLAMARTAGELALTSLDREGGRLSWWPEWNMGRDTVVLWPSDTTLLQGQRFVLHEDGVVVDTLTYRPLGPMPFNLEVKAKNDPASGKWWLESTRPVASVDPAYAKLSRDTVEVAWAVPADSIHGRTIGLDLQPGKDAPMELILYPKAVAGVMGGTNDTVVLSLSMSDPRTLGKLKVELGADSGTVLPGPFVLRLMAGQERVVREATVEGLAGVVEWQGLTPGSYSLSLVQDRNGDGRWTPGAVEEGRQPERVFLDADPVVIRAGWAIERDWIISGTP